MDSIFRKFRALFLDDFARKVTVVLAGTTVAQTIPIIVTPVLARIFSPEDFGLMANIVAVIIILGISATGRFELAIMVPEDERDAAAVAVAAMTLAVATALATIPIIVVSRITLEVVPPEIWAVPFGVLGLAFFNIFTNWSVYRERFGKMARAKIWQTGSMSASQLALGLAHFTSIGLIFGHVFGQLFAALLMMRQAWHKELALFRSLDASAVRAVIKRFRRFPLLSLPAGFINHFSNQLPVFMIAYFFGIGVAGGYALTVRIVGGPVGLIGRSVLDVFKEQASRDYRNDGHCRTIYLRTLKMLTAIAAPIFLILFLYSEDLFVFIFGRDWQEAGRYAEVLSILYFCRFVASPLSYLFYLSARQDLDLYWQVGLVFIVSTAFVVGGLAGDLNLALWLFTIGYSIMYLVYMLMTWLLAQGKLSHLKVH